MKRDRILKYIILMLCTAVFLAACEEEVTPTPTPDFELPTATHTSIPPTALPTSTSIPTVTASPEKSPVPTNPPAAAATIPPTATIIPQVIITVVSSEDGQPVQGANVRLSSPERGFAATFTTLEDGIAHFAGIVFSPDPYTIDVSATGFRPVSVDMSLTRGINTLTVELESGVVARITTDVANLRVGPGLTFDIVVEVQQGQVFPIINVSNDGLWVQVRTPEGLEGWIFTSLVEIEGDLSQVSGGSVNPAPETGSPESNGTPSPTATGAISPTVTAESTDDGTPTPPPAPARPARIPFDADALYQDMLDVQESLVQLRGVLDRRTRDNRIECDEYVPYYNQVITIQTYRNVPVPWVRNHNLYVNSSNNTIDTNQAVYLQCLEGGGQISPFNFRNARNGVDFSLERLRVGILAAEILLDINQPTLTPTPTSTPEAENTPTS